MYDFKALGKSSQQKMGGTKNYIWVAPKSSITNASALTKKTVEAAEGDLVTLNAAVTFGASDGWIKLYATQDMGDFKAEKIGVRDTTAKKLVGTFRHPGNDIKAANFDMQAQNEDWLVLVPDNNGNVFFIGEDGLEATITGSFDTKKISEGDTGWTFTVEAFANGLCYYPSAYAITEKP